MADGPPRPAPARVRWRAYGFVGKARPSSTTRCGKSGASCASCGGRWP